MVSGKLIVLAGVFICVAVCNGQEDKEVQWEARVVTSDKWQAGTDSNVFIEIIGDKGKSRSISLDNDSNNFERKDIDIFVFRSTDVGTPSHLRVWHDDAGISSGWHLKRIELRRLEKAFINTYVFNCECWFAWDEADRKIDRTLPVSKMNWKLWVHTSNMDSADSDSRVWIVVYGDKGHTRHIPLNYERDDFERGATNSFMIDTVEIGTPSKIRVITKDGDDWHLDKIELENMNGAATYTFDCDCWLAKSGQTVWNILVKSPATPFVPTKPFVTAKPFVPATSFIPAKDPSRVTPL